MTRILITTALSLPIASRYDWVMLGHRSVVQTLIMFTAILGHLNQPIAAQVPPRQAPAPVSDQVGTGTVEGIVIYETDRRRRWRFRRNYVADRKVGHLAAAVVCLEGFSGAEQLAAQDWTIDQQEYRFVPEMLAIRAGDRVRFTNSDLVLHNVTTRGPESPPHIDTFSLRQREEVTRIYRDAGGTQRPIALSCRFHGAMQGWILVFDHPFFQVTASEGKFQLTGVPAGSHSLVMVHAAGRLRWEQVIEVRAGETERIEIRVSPDHLMPNNE